MHIKDTVTVNIDINNAGTMAGEEIVQLYIHNLQSGMTHPLKELKGFQKVYLQPGMKKTISFKLSSTDFSFLNLDLKTTCEPGKFEIMVGRNSVDLQKDILEILP